MFISLPFSFLIPPNLDLVDVVYDGKYGEVVEDAASLACQKVLVVLFYCNYLSHSIQVFEMN